eukprot:7221335-Prymnesium_polylepis.2
MRAGAADDTPEAPRSERQRELVQSISPVGIGTIKERATRVIFAAQGRCTAQCVQHSVVVALKVERLHVPLVGHIPPDALQKREIIARHDALPPRVLAHHAKLKAHEQRRPTRQGGHVREERRKGHLHVTEREHVVQDEELARRVPLFGCERLLLCGLDLDVVAQVVGARVDRHPPGLPVADAPRYDALHTPREADGVALPTPLGRVPRQVDLRRRPDRIVGAGHASLEGGRMRDGRGRWAGRAGVLLQYLV